MIIFLPYFTYYLILFHIYVLFHLNLRIPQSLLYLKSTNCHQIHRFIRFNDFPHYEYYIHHTYYSFLQIFFFISTLINISSLIIPLRYLIVILLHNLISPFVHPTLRFIIYDFPQKYFHQIIPLN